MTPPTPTRYVYENMNTLERQDWRPTKPAALSTSRLKAAIAANEMDSLGDITTLADPSVVEHLVENRPHK